MQTSDPAIYAAGDIAEHDGVIRGLWLVAVAQAEVAAANAVEDADRFHRQANPLHEREITGLLTNGCLPGLGSHPRIRSYTRALTESSL